MSPQILEFEIRVERVVLQGVPMAFEWFGIATCQSGIGSPILGALRLERISDDRLRLQQQK